MNEQLMSLLALTASAVLGGIVGLQRELSDKWAGLRTHMLVAMGAAMFVLTAATVVDDASGYVSRVIQGVAAGIGFIGAGTILKLQEKAEIRGLTTAASLWVSAAVGVACALKLFILAAGGTVLSVITLSLVGRAAQALPTTGNGKSDPSPATASRRSRARR